MLDHQDEKGIEARCARLRPLLRQALDVGVVLGLFFGHAYVIKTVRASTTISALPPSATILRIAGEDSKMRSVPLLDEAHSSLRLPITDHVTCSRADRSR